ncbi:NhaP-type Na+/H+ or K+/H+ antiporter [Pedobacter terrae]|uniref:NhaP-type Na+/H+ or K+/H+ antiporter n=1 Tax=Pedobacter terrae TaxID=405671 RepID=A0A1G7VP72_9SPHI|nr:cation:proton antiporter [Pedobacter terrae]SDG61563.1 NhaP-type Na+/H+ or K+/H+ antiporter [Pedobacter terrae]
MSQYILLMLIAGIASIGMAFIPSMARKIGISYSVIYVAVGMLIYLIWPTALPDPRPQKDNSLVLHLTELIVIISLMGTAIKIDRSFSFRKWSTPIRLILIAMILAILISALLGVFVLGLTLSAALLLAAVLAPTDPVLAADVQVGPPNERGKSEPRFALTSEAGLNDGMAFPFTWLAILVASQGISANLLWHWTWYYLFFKIAGGLVIGWLCGKLVGYLVFSISEKYRLLKASDGFLAISLTLFTYAITESFHAYGFIAVFIAGLTLRHYEKGHEYHQQLHSFTDQMERMLLAVLLIFFGGSLVGGVLAPLTLKMALVSVGFVVLVRPFSSYVSLLGSSTPIKEKLAISFFGIRGMGSIYYLAFAFGEVKFEQQDVLWAVVSATILISIVLHGLTATPVMERLSSKKNK